MQELLGVQRENHSPQPRLQHRADCSFAVSVIAFLDSAKYPVTFPFYVGRRISNARDEYPTVAHFSPNHRALCSTYMQEPAVAYFPDRIPSATWRTFLFISRVAFFSFSTIGLAFDSESLAALFISFVYLGIGKSEQAQERSKRAIGIC